MNIWESTVQAVRKLGCFVEKRWERSKLVSVDAPTSIIAEQLDAYLKEQKGNHALTYKIGIK